MEKHGRACRHQHPLAPLPGRYRLGLLLLTTACAAPAVQRDDRFRPSLPTVELAALTAQLAVVGLRAVTSVGVQKGMALPIGLGLTNGETIASLNSVVVGIVPIDVSNSPDEFLACSDTSVVTDVTNSGTTWTYRGSMDVGLLLPRRTKYVAAVRIEGVTENGAAIEPAVLYASGGIGGSDIPYRVQPWLGGTTAQAASGQQPGYDLTVVVDKNAKAGDVEVAKLDTVVGGLVPVDRHGEAQGTFVPGLPAGKPTAFEAKDTDAEIPLLVRLRDLRPNVAVEQWAPAVRADVKLTGKTEGEPASVYFDPTAARPLAVSEPGWGVSYGRMTYGFYLGAIVSQRDGFDFSKVTPNLRFVADTSFEGYFEPEENSNYADWDDFHTIVDVALTSSSTLQKKDDGSTQEIEEGFQGTTKTFSANLGVDYRLLQFDPFDDLVITVGPSVRGGFDSVLDEATAATNESVAEHWGVGVRIVGVGTHSTGELNNPLPRHCASFYWGENDLLRFPRAGVRQSSHRLFFDAMLIVEPNSGFYIGLDGNVGQGPDDVRISFGFAGTAGGLLENLQGLARPRLTP